MLTLPRLRRAGGRRRRAGTLRTSAAIRRPTLQDPESPDSLQDGGDVP